MNLKTKITGHKAQYLFEDVVLKHSNTYQLLCSKYAKENIKAEVERIENDIDLASDLAKLNQNLAEVFQIIRSSNDSTLVQKELTERYQLKAEHVLEFLELELSELTGVNFNIIAEALQKQKTLFQSILNDHLGDK
jgi:DNA gyrase/topoisomerase IV subunit A